MQYFMRDLWAAYNDHVDHSRARQAARQWKENDAAYRRQLSRLLPDLNEDMRAFFGMEDLHAARSFTVTLGDGLITGGSHSEVRLETTVDTGDERLTYTLEYLDVRSIDVHYQEERALNVVFGTILDAWGYDELVRVGDNRFRHGILFSTGAELEITFTDFHWRKRPADGG
jgi:hypothetical protein